MSLVVVVISDVGVVVSSGRGFFAWRRGVGTW